jgi:hypothetical protein
MAYSEQNGSRYSLMGAFSVMCSPNRTPTVRARGQTDPAVSTTPRQLERPFDQDEGCRAECEEKPLDFHRSDESAPPGKWFIIWRWARTICCCSTSNTM